MAARAVPARPTRTASISIRRSARQWWAAGATQLSLRAGRQEVAFGSSRLVSVREGPNVRRSFDGVRATVAARNWQLDGIGLASAKTERGEFDDDTDRGERLWGVYASGPLRGAALGLDLYWLALRRDDAEYDQGTHNERRRSIGTRIWGAPGAWDYNFELVYQWGSFGAGDIEAWTAASDTGYTLTALPMQPRLGLRANVTSGDRSPSSSKLETFNPLFPRGSYFGEASLIGPQNHMDLHPMLELHAAGRRPGDGGLGFLLAHECRRRDLPRVGCAARLGGGERRALRRKSGIGGDRLAAGAPCRARRHVRALLRGAVPARCLAPRRELRRGVAEHPDLSGAGMTRTLPPALASLLLLLACAHFPINAPLDRSDPAYGYRVSATSGDTDDSRELLLIVNFSGGGTRAAAFAYGALQALRDARVRFDGRERSLADEIDILASVSGGSFTAAYFALNGARTFDEFEERFLRRDIQRALLWRLLSPWNWVRLASPYFGRSDLAAEYYDKELFHGATLGDLLQGDGPALLINATDMTLAARFTFDQEQFDLLCSDTLRFPIARAVAASSAVPLALSPVTLKNYAARGCGYDPPAWVGEEIGRGYSSSRGCTRRRCGSRSTAPRRPIPTCTSSMARSPTIWGCAPRSRSRSRPAAMGDWPRVPASSASAASRSS